MSDLPSNADKYRLFGDRRSGNCWKPALTMARLGIACEWVDMNVLDGSTRSPEFLARNPNGKVPLLELPDGRYLAESNAMLLYLAEGTVLMPEDRWTRAQVWQWLFWEQYSHEPYIAVARFLRHFRPELPQDPARMAMLDQRGTQALALMDSTLRQQPFFAGDAFTIADIALFAYTHVADEGGFELEAWPGILAWMDRVRAQPAHFDLAALSA